MGLQLLLQHPTGLDEETSIDGLGRHAHSLVAGVRPHKPARDLLRRPVLGELSGDDAAQPRVARQEARLGPAGLVPRSLVGAGCAIARWSAAARDLTADRRGGAPER